MKVVGLEIMPLAIPFIERFRHSIRDRSASDAVVACLKFDDGTVGYGEGLPRPYVTGESVTDMVSHITDVLWPTLLEIDWSAAADIQEIAARLPEDDPHERVRAFNAARCAVELALIDAWTKKRGEGIAAQLPPTSSEVRYSAVITGGAPDVAASRAKQFGRLGLTDVKMKVGVEGAVERVAAVREVIGPEATLRVDSNAAWTVEQAIDILNALTPYDIAACEEPITPMNWDGLAQVRAETSIPIMVDESFVTLDDARQLVAVGGADILNVRLSKCGGLVRCLEAVEFARDNGLKYQIGAHVGETSILSAAGRHLAAHIGDALFVEGSYGTMLLSEDVCRTSVRFGYRGVGPLIRGRGLGINVLPERLERFAQETIRLEA